MSTMSHPVCFIKNKEDYAHVSNNLHKTALSHADTTQSLRVKNDSVKNYIKK